MFDESRRKMSREMSRMDCRAKRFRVHPDVYFKQYGEYTYLRHVGQRTDYLLNEIAYDILHIITAEECCTAEKICEELSKLYEVPSDSLLTEDVLHFLEDVAESRVLLPDEESAAPQEESVRELIQQMCCEEGLLLSACLELTYRCNEKCIHCYVDDPSQARLELRYKDYTKIIDELSGMGCMSILITGGEPSLHPDFYEILSYIKHKRILIDLYTNGLELQDEMLYRIIALKPNSISFSFYGGTADVHDRITQVPGSFEKSLRTMLICKCAGIDTYIKTVVMRQNAEQYESLLQFGRRLGIVVKSSLSVMPTHTGKSADEFRLFNVGEYRRILQLEYEYGNDSVKDELGERVEQVCASGLSTISVDPFGVVHPCNASPIELGNIRETTIKSIWEHSRELERIRKIKFNDVSDHCLHCPDKSWCGICMGSALRENGRLAPCTDTCMIAHANHMEYVNQKKKEVRAHEKEEGI